MPLQSHPLYCATMYFLGGFQLLVQLVDCLTASLEIGRKRTFLNEATVDLELLATLEQFEDQATDRLLVSVLVEQEKEGAKEEFHKGRKQGQERG